MVKTLKIDFVSDISCPWCAIGLASLNQALARLAPTVSADLHFQPFELNPQMGPLGQDVSEHLTQKYGSNPEQQAANRANITERGAQLGFAFNPAGRGRVWNTFDAHRLLHWAGLLGQAQQLALKTALLQACHTQSSAMNDPQVLVACVSQAGLDAKDAQEILASDRFADDVRQSEAFYQQAGIHSVPAVIINDRHLISGGQPPEVFEQALRQIAAEASAAAS